MIPEELSRTLSALADERRLADRAIQSCQRALEHARQEAFDVGAPFLEGRQLSDLVIKWERNALVFQHRILGRPFVETRVGVYLPDPEAHHLEGLRPVGSFRLITDLLTGNDEDDYLELPDDPALESGPGSPTRR